MGLGVGVGDKASVPGSGRGSGGGSGMPLVFSVKIGQLGKKSPNVADHFRYVLPLDL